MSKFILTIDECVTKNWDGVVMLHQVVLWNDPVGSLFSVHRLIVCNLSVGVAATLCCKTNGSYLATLASYMIDHDV